MTLKDDIAFNTSLLKLDPIDEINYSFIKTLQNKLQDCDYQKQFERELQEKMLKRFQEQHRPYNPDDLILKLPHYELHEITKERFQSLVTHSPFTPFIIKGFLNDTPAVKHWTVDYLMQHCPDVQVAYTLTDQSGSSAIEFDTLAHTLELMAACSEDKFIYIHNTSQLFKEHPELVKQLELGRINDLFKPLARCIVPHLFLGGPRSGISIHAANEVNSFFMINGTKEWTLVDPQFSYAINGILSLNARNAYQGQDDNPLYDYIPKYIDTVESGDLLVFGPWWWHAVDNTSPSTIAVATRWSPMRHHVFDRGNIIFQNIQHSNKDFQNVTGEIMSAILNEEIIGDDLLHGKYKLSYDIKKKDDEA